jgi:hypothetical protein
MRLFLCCLGLLYGAGSVVDSVWIKPSQTEALNQVLSEETPAYFGESARLARRLPAD